MLTHIRSQNLLKFSSVRSIVLHHGLDPDLEIFQLGTNVKDYYTEERAHGGVTEPGEGAAQSLADDCQLVHRCPINVDEINRLEDQRPLPGVRQIRQGSQNDSEYDGRMVNENGRGDHRVSTERYYSRELGVLDHYFPFVFVSRPVPIIPDEIHHRDDHLKKEQKKKKKKNDNTR